jgi:CheY-like chemotaxis protein
VLIVDDDRALLETTSAVLEEEFDVAMAANGHVALGLLEQQPYQVVCADYDMPGIDGVSLLRRIHQRHPSTSGILVTGLRDQLPQGIGGDECIFAVVYKPYSVAALCRTIQEAAKLLAMTRAVASFGRSSKRLGKK